MCRSAIHDFLAAAPKCEHHMHLEGALMPSLLFKLASRNDITLNAEDPSFASPDDLLARFDRFTSLDDFLHYYFIGMSCLIQAEDFEDLAWDYFLKAKKDNVVHAELFFDPQAHTSRGVQYDTIVSGFSNACTRANEELNISTLLIPCFLRHLPQEDSQTFWAQVKGDLVSKKLTGVGLSGSEKAFPPAAWKTFYQEAQRLGIRRTAHAGEEGPVDFIRQALTELRIERIDHGFRLADDEGLMKEISEQQILVTLCPLSNVKLRCVQDVKELPIRKFLDAGVQFSLNSDGKLCSCAQTPPFLGIENDSQGAEPPQASLDARPSAEQSKATLIRIIVDPAYFRSYILDNYCAVQEAFDLSLQEWTSVLQAAVNGSWCNEDRKNTLREEIKATVRKYQEV